MTQDKRDELLLLLKHQLRGASDLVELLSRELADEPEPAPASAPTPAPKARASQDPIEIVLSRGNPRTQEIARAILENVEGLDDYTGPIPERPRHQKPPRYLRLARGRKSFAYMHVRQDHLRIDLAVPGENAEQLEGREVRAREVKADNPWQVAFYARREEDVNTAVEAIRFAHGEVEDQ